MGSIIKSKKKVNDYVFERITMFSLTIHIYTLNSLILSTQKSFKDNESILSFIKDLSTQDKAIIKSNIFHTRIIKFNHEGKDYSFYF